MNARRDSLRLLAIAMLMALFVPPGSARSGVPKPQSEQPASETEAPSLENLDLLVRKERALVDRSRRETAEAVSRVDEEARKLAESAMTMAAYRLAVAKNLEAEEKQRAGRREEVQMRYSAGRGLLRDMQGRTQFLVLAFDLLRLENMLGRTAAIWEDVSIRNTWDEVRDWGTALGGILIAVGAGVSSGEDRGGSGNALLLTGGLAAALSQIVGAMGGGSEVKEKVATIEFTRSAYDDLKNRGDLLETTRVRAVSLTERLAAVGKKYGDLLAYWREEDGAKPAAELTPDQRMSLQRRAIRELRKASDLLGEVLRLTDGVLEGYRDVLAKYDGAVVSLGLPESFRSLISSLRPNFERVSCGYFGSPKAGLTVEGKCTTPVEESVRRFLDMSVEVDALLDEP